MFFCNTNEWKECKLSINKVNNRGSTVKHICSEAVNLGLYPVEELPSFSNLPFCHGGNFFIKHTIYIFFFTALSDFHNQGSSLLVKWKYYTVQLHNLHKPWRTLKKVLWEWSSSLWYHYKAKLVWAMCKFMQSHLSEYTDRRHCCLCCCMYLC